MTLKKFKEYSDPEQARLLQQYGVFLAERITSQGNRVYLFSFSSFYIELFHELTNVHSTGVKILSVFEDSLSLDKYLEEVNISDLLLYS
jgi:hypothetical protein